MAVTSTTRRTRTRWWSAVLSRALWALTLLGVAVTVWLDQLLRQAGRLDLLVVTPTAIAPLLGAVSVATVGAVLASRRARHPVGWLMLAFGLSLSAAGSALAYTNYGVAHADAAPAAALVARYVPAAIVMAIVCCGLILLLTPTGALPSPRWRWWVWVTTATPVTLLLIVTLEPRPGDRLAQGVDSPLDLRTLDGALLVAYQAAFAVTIIAFVVAAASLVVRFRRARGTEREQLRWVALATVVVALLSVVHLAALALGAFALAPLVGGLSPPILSAAIGVAILRNRLYDLDRIISRTLAYGLLTVLLGGGHAGVVLALGQLFGAGDRTPSWAVAGATLAAAALFQPARRRIQQAVDRRFNRRRYNAVQTIQAFSTRLREQIDLDTLSAELLAVVDQTVEPTRVSFWLRPSRPGSSGTARSGARLPPWTY
jgi:hypothetical protein